MALSFRYPNFGYLSQLLPKLFINKHIYLFCCESCALAKHHMSVFRPRPYKKSALFTLIHSDV